MRTFEHWEQFVKQTKEQLKTSREKIKETEQEVKYLSQSAEDPKFKKNSEE